VSLNQCQQKLRNLSTKGKTKELKGQNRIFKNCGTIEKRSNINTREYQREKEKRGKRSIRGNNDFKLSKINDRHQTTYVGN